MHKLICRLAAGAALALVGLSAEAATITRTYTFSMSGYTPTYGTPAPVDPVTGSFTVTFDPTVAIYNATSGLTVHDFNLPIGQLAFSYTPFGVLSLYGALNTSAAVFGTDDFYVSWFQPLKDTPIAPFSSYTRAGVRDGWSTQSGTVTAQTVPEPATWALVIMGFGATGAALRRRRPLAA